jgi:phosphoribosylaminoimidazole-succinocarboxamide synthase
MSEELLYPQSAEVFANIELPAGLGLMKLESGKVREKYLGPNGELILITTDRISAFDRVLGTIPYKGQVLNRLSEFWFKNTRDIISNHMLAVPDPNVMVCEATTPLPVEVVVRGYMKGVSSTSIWPMYSEGERDMYGGHFREGYKYGDRLDEVIITPTTKAKSGHDKPITEKEIVKSGLVSAGIWEETRTAAISLFNRGQEVAKKSGLLMIDAKIEFGLDINGELLVIDELFTPDSAGFWLADTYEECLRQGEKPDIYDKEFLRIQYSQIGYKGEGDPPPIPTDLRDELSRRYVFVFERITKGAIQNGGEKLRNRIVQNIVRYYG